MCTGSTGMLRVSWSGLLLKSLVSLLVFCLFCHFLKKGISLWKQCIVYLLYYFFWEKVSARLALDCLCSPGWPWTPSVSALLPQELGWQVYFLCQACLGFLYVLLVLINFRGLLLGDKHSRVCPQVTHLVLQNDSSWWCSWLWGLLWSSSVELLGFLLTNDSGPYLFWPFAFSLFVSVRYVSEAGAPVQWERQISFTLYPWHCPKAAAAKCIASRQFIISIPSFGPAWPGTPHRPG